MVETFKLSGQVTCKPLDEWQSIAVELLGTQTRFVQGARWRHRIIDAGDGGEPLLLIHGIGGHAETFARNLRNLAAHGFHAIAIDALHHGYTDKHPYDDETRIDLQVDALVDLIDALGYERVHIEGESLGAMLAFELGMRAPHRCGKLILNTGIGQVRTKKTDFVSDPNDFKTLSELSHKSIVDPTYVNMRNRMEWLVVNPDRMTDEMVQVRLRLYSDPEIIESMRNIFMIGKTPTWTFRWDEEDLQRFQPETLVFWTEHNPGQGPDYGEYMAGLFPHAKFYNMLDAAHWPQWEKPEEHDRVLIEFIKGSGA